MADSSSDDEIFLDAKTLDDEDVLEDLTSKVEHTSVSLHLFLNNHFVESRDRLRPYIEKSFYHSHGYSTIMSLEAFMTFQPEIMDDALDSLKKTIEICGKYRKKNGMLESLNNLVRGTDYNSYTEEEVHAELCYAEAHLLQAILTLFQDENMISFVRSGLKIRSSYHSYRDCYQMLKNRNWDGGKAEKHFLSGVHFGVGTFHLLMSLLPAKVVKLLQFIGFSAKRKTGLEELRKGHKFFSATRGPLCGLVLLLYNFILIQMIDQDEVDLDYAKNELLKPFLMNYPNGSLTRLFSGRYHVLTGEFDKSIEIYHEAATCQKEWKHFNHLLYWEATWSHAYLCQWKQATECLSILLNENRWSKTTYAYMKASCMCMQQTSLTEKETLELYDLMNRIPDWKQRIAGKSIPIEKFAVQKAEKFREQKKLCIPVLEIIYFWGTFQILKNNPPALKKMFDIVEDSLTEVTKTGETNQYYWDDRSLVLLIKAVCLRLMDKPTEAEVLLREVCDEAKRVKLDVHVPAFAQYELGLIYLSTGRVKQAQETLETASTKYKGFLENRLFVRCRAGLRRLRELNATTPTSDTNGNNTVKNGMKTHFSTNSDIMPEMTTVPSPEIEETRIITGEVTHL